MSERIYVTTSIPYVNADPHIGFALELVQADVIARYHRLLGHETRFQTGTDENAFKNVLAAQQQGLTTPELVDRNAASFRRLNEALGVSSDTFIRTTEARHRRGVHRLWQQLRPDDVYLRSYTGRYCTGCEDFYLERDLVNGRCPDHGTEPVRVSETNYFFRLSAYQAQIEELLDTGRLEVVPASRRNEALSFVRRGLQDISISRASERSGGWGIPVPGDPSQVIYVWIDALVNYISGLGFGTSDEWSEFWCDDATKVHVIGKNVWKFHAVYWPALLLSAGLPLPDRIVVHGFLTVDGRKIGKALGNAIDPFACIDRYSLDATRYYLLRGIPSLDDADFSTERLTLLHNTDLANGLGNLVSRLTSLCEKTGYGRYEQRRTPAAPQSYHECLHAHKLDRALATQWSLVTDLNQDIEREQPWQTIKAGRAHTLRQQLTLWLDELQRISYWLSPFLPNTSRRIQHALAREPLLASQPLFPRLK